MASPDYFLKSFWLKSLKANYSTVLTVFPPGSIVPSTSVDYNCVQKKSDFPFSFFTAALFVSLREEDQKYAHSLSPSVSTAAHCTLCIETMSQSVKQLSCLLPHPQFSFNNGNILSSSFSSPLTLILLAPGNWQRTLIIFTLCCCSVCAESGQLQYSSSRQPNLSIMRRFPQAGHIVYMCVQHSLCMQMQAFHLIQSLTNKHNRRRFSWCCFYAMKAEQHEHDVFC